MAPNYPNLSWGTSDGIHLNQYEPSGAYDVIISDRVVEHLHPDDLVAHFEGTHALLSSSGRYIVSTPQAYAGPADISRVFQSDSVNGMHLKEYMHAEISTAFRAAGFQRCHAVLRISAGYRTPIRGGCKPRMSRTYTSYIRLLENVIATIPQQHLRRRATKALKPLLFPSNIMMVAVKSLVKVRTTASKEPTMLP